MKPPTNEEEEMAEEFVDDGYGLHFDVKDPWSIQEALDDIQRDLRIYVALNNDHIFEWESGNINRRRNILTLVQNVRRERELVSVSNTFENLYRASIELEETQCQYRLDQEEYEENRKWAEIDITLRKRQIAVIEDVLRRSLCGDLVEEINIPPWPRPYIPGPGPWEIVEID
jgi:hypothetical protein